MSKNIKLIIGSTRQKRAATPIADWLVQVAKEQDVNLEILDLKEINLPTFNAPISPAYAPSTTSDGIAWSKQISAADGIVFLTSEYNRSIPSPLKNAVDYLYAEWNEMPATIVSYGYVDGGASAAKHLTDILNWLKVDLEEPATTISLGRETFDESGNIKDADKEFASAKKSFQLALNKIVEAKIPAEATA